MSLLIRGMEMPKNCDECNFDAGGYCLAKSLNFLDWCEVNDRPRPSWCPITEVKPHGRLIDADALNELIDSGDDIDFSEVPETKYAIMQMVNEQDTILEASPYRYKMIGKTDKPHGIYFIESEGEDGIHTES